MPLVDCNTPSTFLLAQFALFISYVSVHGTLICKYSPLSRFVQFVPLILSLSTFSLRLLPLPTDHSNIPVTLLQGQVLSSPSFDTYEYILPLPLPLPMPSPSPLPLVQKSDVRLIELEKRNQELLGQLSSLLPSVRVRHQDPYHFDSRECKMRIVERLGTVGSALQSEVAAGSQHLKGTNRATSTDQLIYPDTGTIQNPHTTIEECKLVVNDDAEKSKDRGMECRESVSPVPAFQWLDDAQLGVLNTAELEEVMDRYLISVVQQLVQVSQHCTICIEIALTVHCASLYRTILKCATLH